MAEESSEASSFENPLAPSNFSNKKPNQEEDLEDTAALPVPKRRKTCLKSLEKVHESSPSNGNFSFTFNTESTPCVPEFTPKFGSFSFAEKDQVHDQNQDQDQDQPFQNPKHKHGAQQVEGEEKDKDSGVGKERTANVVSASGSDLSFSV